MKIDQKLNLVIPVYEDDTQTTVRAHVYSTPVSREVFERYYLVIAKTHSKIFDAQLSYPAMVKIAGLALKDVAKEAGLWDGPEGVERGFVAEIARLTSVVAMTENGWQPLPYERARKEMILSDEDAREVDNAIVFFIVCCCMMKQKEMQRIVAPMSQFLGGQLTALSLSGYIASLPTSTTADSSTKPVA